MVCNDFLKNTCNPSCKKIHGCIKSYDNRRYVTCEERNKKYTLDNARSVNIANYHMDGGVIQNDPEKKCDFLIFVEDASEVILIELKGTDYSKALKQLYNTIVLLKDQLNSYKIYARVVGKEIPRIASGPDIVKLKKALKQYGGNFMSASDYLIEKETKLS